MTDDIRVERIDARVYFVSIDLGLKWHSYEDLRKILDLRLMTTAVGPLTNQLAKLMAEDAAEMGLAGRPVKIQKSNVERRQ